ILATVGWHSYWAHRVGILVPWYLVALAVPVTVLLLACMLFIFYNRVVCRGEDEQGVVVWSLTHRITAAEAAVLTPPPGYGSPALHHAKSAPHYTRKHPRYIFHLHHWQIFFALAFFTRFTHPLSQAMAGLCLGVFMQGGFAYNFDPLFMSWFTK